MVVVGPGARVKIYIYMAVCKLNLNNNRHKRHVLHKLNENETKK